MTVSATGLPLLEAMPENAAQAREAHGPRNAPNAASAADAARQFEGLLMQQLLQILRKTAPSGGLMGGDSSGEMYVQMFDEAIAEALSKGDGIGLRDMLIEGLGGEVAKPGGQLTGTLRREHPAGVEASRAPAAGAPIGGLGGRLQHAAASMMSGDPKRWGREGALLPGDLGNGFSTPAPGGEAAFNVRDARGYQGYYKCNLFTLELARRAGFEVPVTGRARGWGYPSPSTVTPDAADGNLRGGWARVATGEPAESIDRGAVRGDRAFMLTGSGMPGRHGHMGVVERVHGIDYGAGGEIKRVVFDGWEARPNGAEHLTRRVWNVHGNPGGGPSQRNGFESIEILELQHARGGQREVPLTRGAGASRHDGGGNTEFSPRASSYLQTRPILRSEEPR